MINESIKKFLQTFSSENKIQLNTLKQSGSAKKYYRFSSENQSYILTENPNVQENLTFFYLTDLLNNLNIKVPQIIKISKDKNFYIQEDLGEISLLDLRLNQTEQTINIYKKVVQQLVQAQIGADQIVDYSDFFSFKKFDKTLILRDLFYFKNYYLDFSGLEYNEYHLLSEFDKLANEIENAHYQYFMFRDFQGRNVMIKNENPYFIDYQGAMKGPIAYDLASLLWQAKANLSQEEKEELFDFYAEKLKQLIPNEFNIEKLKSDYQYCTFIRLLQVLGAYGKLGLIEKKPHFLESISFGIDNLKTFQSSEIRRNFPTLQLIIQELKTIENLKN